MKNISLTAVTLILTLSGCASNGTPSMVDQVSTAASVEAGFISQAFGIATGNDTEKNTKDSKHTIKTKKSNGLHPMTADEVNALLKNDGHNKGIYTSGDLLNKMRDMFN